MTFKVLKHKTLPDTFGVFRGGDPLYYEIFYGQIPELLSVDASMDNLITYWKNLGQETVIEQLNDYDLIEVELKIK